MLLNDPGPAGDAHGRQTHVVFRGSTLRITEEPPWGGPTTPQVPHQCLTTWAEFGGLGGSPGEDGNVCHCALGKEWGLLTHGRSMVISIPLPSGEPTEALHPMGPCLPGWLLQP